jgi:hypothetical protein
MEMDRSGGTDDQDGTQTRTDQCSVSYNVSSQSMFDKADDGMMARWHDGTMAV